MSDTAALLARYQLGEEACNQQVTDRHLDEIASSYCRRWRSLRAELGLKAIVEHDIDHSIPGDEEGKRLALFNKWKLMKGSSATYKALISALLEIKCQDDAEGVCEVLKKSLRPAPSEAKDVTRQCEDSVDSSASVVAPSSTTVSAMPPLDPEVREDLEHILRINRNRIITLYAHFVSSLCDCLVDKGVSVHRLRTFLLKMPAFERGDDKQCQAKLLSGVKSKLEEADTVYKIFDLLGEECASFLNYDIYRSIQDKFCSDVDCDDFKYPEYLKAYIEQHKLKEFFDVNPKLEKLTKASKKLKLKMDIELTSKVARVINLKSSLAALLGLRPSALRLFSIEEGCVLVTFLIPATVAGSVFPADKKVDAQQMEGFRSLSVLWATCGDFHMDFRDSASLSSLLSWPEHPQAEATVIPQDDGIAFPEQQILYRFRGHHHLTIGTDGHYYEHRDYSTVNDLWAGSTFGSVKLAKDIVTEHQFAIKYNESDDHFIIKAMETEAKLLSQLGPHTNVIGMYGAVLDCQEHESLPDTVYKLMMEYSPDGDLAKMLLDPYTSEPFPLDRDQALFYFWQVLKGVDFLHKNNVLHLDIKGSNILVFDEGRTLKICNFEMAMHVDEVASKAGKHLGTLHFLAPEVVRQEMPDSSSDMWSTMCVLVEMLTGQKPWEHKANLGLIILYMIGWYSEEHLEVDLIPPTPGVEMDPEVIDLMRLVFRADRDERASARELLEHPLITGAHTYEVCFHDELSSLHQIPVQTTKKDVKLEHRHSSNKPIFVN